MKSETIKIDNTGRGFAEAIAEARRAAAGAGLGETEILRVEILAEEMLSLARSITGEMSASFWVELENGRTDLHMNTKTVLDKEKRAMLIASSTSKKNEAAGTFLGRLRDMVEKAMTADAKHYAPPTDILGDISGDEYEAEWDGYERSILRRLADEIKIGIQGGVVSITVSKRF